MKQSCTRKRSEFSNNSQGNVRTRLSSLKILLSIVFILLPACCDKSAISSNTKLLYSSESKYKNQAALDLARCGEKASAAVPRLIALLYDENVGVQSSAAYALRQIDTPEARSALADATARKQKK